MDTIPEPISHKGLEQKKEPPLFLYRNFGEFE